MKKLLLNILAVLAVVFAVSCEKEQEQQPATPNVSFDIEVPSTLKTYEGAEVTFTCASGKGLANGDILNLKSGSKAIQCQVIDIKDTQFTFVVPDGLKSGSYFVWVKRNGTEKKVGVVSITIVDKADLPTGGYNITGKVTANGLPVSGVVVSDGYQTVQTSTSGTYFMQSNKKRGYVFISVPSGYEAKSNGVMPIFHKSIKKDEYEIAEANFELTKVDGQDNHIMYIMGDLHLANRNSDLKQFDTFAADLNKQISANSGRRQYLLTLGDMTWEIYWGNYTLSNYVREMNNKFSNVQVFNTIGNHDHDVNAEGDFNTVLQYFQYIGPNYYSFNIGSVHYVVLDDILCKNTGEGTSASRDYTDKIDPEQLEWLKKDLSYVDPNMTVVVTSHATLYRPSGALTFSESLADLSTVLSCFSKFSKLHFFTGHTHENINVDNTSKSIPHFEHNAGSVCATWWWTYSTCGMNLARDGAPGGYTICDFNKGDFKWVFKGYDRPVDYQFRAYDMNKVDSSTFPSGYNTYSTTPANSILINIWNWDPKWKLSVKENGKELSWQQVYNYDPLHVLGYTKVRGTGTTSSFLSKKNPHLFMVQATTANASVEIEVTDRFGNVYKETMTRPRDFKVETYQK